MLGQKLDRLNGPAEEPEEMGKCAREVGKSAPPIPSSSLPPQLWHPVLQIPLSLAQPRPWLLSQTRSWHISRLLLLLLNPLQLLFQPIPSPLLLPMSLHLSIPLQLILLLIQPSIPPLPLILLLLLVLSPLLPRHLPILLLLSSLSLLPLLQSSLSLPPQSPLGLGAFGRNKTVKSRYMSCHAHDVELRRLVVRNL